MKISLECGADPLLDCPFILKSCFSCVLCEYSLLNPIYIGHNALIYLQSEPKRTIEIDQAKLVVSWSRQVKAKVPFK
jgi:hypothetical protein